MVRGNREESPDWAPEAELLSKHKALLGCFVLDDLSVSRIWKRLHQKHKYTETLSSAAWALVLPHLCSLRKREDQELGQFAINPQNQSQLILLDSGCLFFCSLLLAITFNSNLRDWFVSFSPVQFHTKFSISRISKILRKENGKKWNSCHACWHTLF